MIYIFYFIFIVIGACIIQASSRIIFLKYIIFFLWLIIGLRSSEVGVDTVGYIDDFQRYSSFSVSEMINSLKFSKEPLFNIISWFIGQFFSNSVVFTLTWALFPCIALFQILKEELGQPKDYLVSILCFFSLGLFAFFIAGIRQTAAISLIFLSYRYLKRIDFSFSISSYKNWNFIKFIICIFLAYNSHNSSILFLVALPLLKIPVRWWYLPVVVGLSFIGNYVRLDFLTQLSALFFDDRFANYGTVYESSQSINAFIMQFVLFMICYLRRERLIRKDKYNNYLFNIILVGMVFQSMSGMIYEMARVSFYFSIFSIILVPKAMKEYALSLQTVLYTGFTILVLIYLIFLSGSNLPEYKSIFF